MLESIDESLEAFFRATVPLGATDVDVSFDPPDREWTATLSRPTVNIFLWDIRRSLNKARAGRRTVARDGPTFYEVPPPFLELRYVVTTWAGDRHHERALLSGVIRSLLSNGVIGRDHLGPAFDGVEVPSLTMAAAGDERIDVSAVLDGQLKPGLNMVLTTEFDLGVRHPAGPLVGSLEGTFGRFASDTTGSIRQVRSES